MRLTRASTLGIITAALFATTAGTMSAQSPATSAAPSPDPSASPVPEAVALEPGTYHGPMVGGLPGEWTVTVPDGWEKFYEILWKDLDGVADYRDLGGPGEVALGWWTVDNVFTDPCHWKDSLADPPVGPSVDDLVDALANQAGRTSSGPATDVILGGQPAKRIELLVESGADPATCDEGVSRDFLYPGESLDIGQPELLRALSPIMGERIVLYVLDLAGTRWLLRTWHAPDASAQDLADLEAMLASIRVDIPTQGPSPTPIPSAAG
jgi:hypothetical protein